ncbi:MAG TPA: helix-turn-helix domain-containing protein [Mycobacteriales bacterium]|nr:helix-turn-helix domain-containing protein [Mycobacteriales bacterium]
MSLAGVVDDLIALQRLADQERDAARRRALEAVRQHVAERDRGAKVAEAAQVLGVSAPTVRAWIDAGVLRPLAATGPARVDVASLAATKQVVDELRRHREDRHLLTEVLRLLRDRAAFSGDDAHAAVEDAAAGRVRRLDRAGLDELLPAKRPKRSTST